MIKSITKEQALYFKRMFRHARSTAMDDAEGFQEIVFAIERLGMQLYGKSGNLGAYKKSIGDLTVGILEKSEFDKNYALVQNGRNSALHQGAYARNLTRHCIELSLQIEEALNRIIMKEQMNLTVSDLMISGPTTALLWQPLNLVRQLMLAHSFSYVPICKDGTWRLLSENNIVAYLGPEITNRKSKLAQPIEDATKDGTLILIDAEVCNKDCSLGELIQIFNRNQGRPVLVMREEELVGLITPFDLL
ncbi:MAG: CBS domain-containing protein [Saprospiraceae bacterium]|nr:CBS domain-containing protein [Saprospiraceae bacterium]